MDRREVRGLISTAVAQDLEAYCYRRALAGDSWSSIAAHARATEQEGGIERSIRPADARRAAGRMAKRIAAKIDKLERDEAENVVAIKRVHADLLRHWSQHHDGPSWELMRYLDGRLEARDRMADSSSTLGR